MRRAWVSVVLVAVATACNGGIEDAPPLTTVPPTDPPAVTEPATTDPPDSGPAPEGSTTEPPRTTIDEAGEIEAVEQAAIDAYNAYHAAILDPSNPDLRAEIERTHGGQALARVLRSLDDLGTLNQVALPHAELQPTVDVVGAVRFFDVDDGRDFADLVVCEINPEKFVEIGAAPDGSNALVRDDVFTVRSIMEFEKLVDRWKFVAGEFASVKIGVVPCE